MNVKTSKAKKQVNIENETVNLLSKEELNKRIEVIKKELRSYTWRELEKKVSLSRTTNCPLSRMTCLS